MTFNSLHFLESLSFAFRSARKWSTCSAPSFIPVLSSCESIKTRRQKYSKPVNVWFYLMQCLYGQQILIVHGHQNLNVLGQQVCRGVCVRFFQSLISSWYKIDGDTFDKIFAQISSSIYMFLRSVYLISVAPKEQMLYLKQSEKPFLPTFHHMIQVW